MFRYIVQPLIDSDLHHAMDLSHFDENSIAYVMYQLFRGMKYLHSAQIIHRDIKPSNILIDAWSKIKVNLQLFSGYFSIFRYVTLVWRVCSTMWKRKICMEWPNMLQRVGIELRKSWLHRESMTKRLTFGRPVVFLLSLWVRLHRAFYFPVCIIRKWLAWWSDIWVRRLQATCRMLRIRR